MKLYHEEAHMANVANITPKVLEWARKYNDLTRSDLADKIHVHENQIVKWETGKTKPTFNQASELANALHIPFGIFFLVPRRIWKRRCLT